MAFEAVNDLERSLMRAATDPAHRPQFYRDFLASDVFALTGGSLSSNHGHTTLKGGDQVPLLTLDLAGKKVLPIFSSLVQVTHFIKHEETYMAMKTKALLELALGDDLMLNPGAQYGKEFTATEIKSLLDGSIWKPTETWVAQKPTNVMIGQPANYPHALVDALRRFFKTTPNVRRAYLAHFFNPERDEKAHTLIAIEASGDYEKIVSGAGIVATAVKIPDPPVDFMRVEGSEGINGHFRSGVKPFYERKIFGIF